MSPAHATLLFGALLVASPPLGSSTGQRDLPTPPATAAAERPAVPGLPSLPIAFEANRGQGEPGAGYLVRTGAIEASLFDRRAVFHLMSDASFDRIEMSFPGSRPEAALGGTEPTRGRSHYFLGSDPSRWIRDIPQFRGARVAGLYPGIDLRWTAGDGRLRYDFLVEPGASPESLRVKFEGAVGADVDAAGGLEVRTGNGRFRHSRPVAWQVAEGGRVPVSARFAKAREGFAIALGAYDRALPLVIDPTVEFSSLIGPGNVTRLGGAAVDGDGNFYVGGHTNVSNYPVKNAYQSTRNASDDIVVTKIDPADNSILFSTYLGSAQQDRFAALALDAENAVYITGHTGAVDDSWPTVNPWIGEHQGGLDAVVAKIGPTGGTLEYSTYLGGAGSDKGRGIAVDAEGSAWVVGTTASLDFPLTGTPLDGTGDGDDGFFVKFTPSGASADASTYLGGTGGDGAQWIAVAPDGTAWITGYTNSSNFPVVDAVQEDLGGGTDAFLIAIASSGGSILLSTYYGGSGDDSGWSIDVDPFGRVFVAGVTGSADFPTVDPWQDSLGNSTTDDAFVLRLDPSSGTVTYATYLGGSGMEGGWESGMGIAVDGEGRAFVTGYTTSSDFPVASPTQASIQGDRDFFVTVLSPDGSDVPYSSYYGAAGEDLGVGIATDGGDVVIAGTTRSTGFPTFDSLGGSWSGQIVGAVLRLGFAPVPMREFRLVQAHGDQLDLAWADPHGGAYDIEVERMDAGGAFGVVATVTDGATEWSDTDLLEDHDYVYRLRGTSSGGKTAYSAWLATRTTFIGPAGLAAVVPGNRRVDLTWEDGSAVETGYGVWRRAVASEAEFTLLESLPPDSTSYVDEGVAPETAYEYLVRGTGPAGTTADTAVVPATTPPADPTDLAVVVRNDVEVRLTWKDASGAEDGYRIERRNDLEGGEFTLLVVTEADDEDHDDATVGAETGYTYRVRAENSHGVSEWTPTVSATTAPATPTEITAEPVSPTAIAVSWVDASEAESGFILERSPLGANLFTSIASPGADVTFHLDAGLLQDTAYEYRLRAWNGNGSSRHLRSEGVETFAQLAIDRAQWTPARKKKAARFQVTGRMDVDPASTDLAGAATLRLNGVAFDIPGFAQIKKGKVLRHEQEGLTLDLLPPPEGTSNVAFSLLLTGATAEGVDREGDLELRFTSGTYDGMGTAALSDGGFDPRKGIGVWKSPSLYISSIKANVRKPGNHSLVLTASFVPFDPPPAETPTVRIELGQYLDATFDGGEFAARGSVLVYSRKEPDTWKITLDLVKGTLVARGKRLDLGEFPEGSVPLHLEVSVGDRRIVDDPVLSGNGKTLSY